MLIDINAYTEIKLPLKTKKRGRPKAAELTVMVCLKKTKETDKHKPIPLD